MGQSGTDEMEVERNEGNVRGRGEEPSDEPRGSDQSAQSSKMVSSLVVVGLCLAVCGTADSDNNVNTVIERGSNLTTEEISDVMSELREAGMNVTRDETGLTVTARMKMSDFMFNPLLFVPSFIAWGFAPILLANLKLFVFQALMINQVALSSALYMTLKNIVFGPRPGNFVKYANYGYGANEFHHHHHRRRTAAHVRM